MMRQQKKLSSATNPTFCHRERSRPAQAGLRSRKIPTFCIAAYAPRDPVRKASSLEPLLFHPHLCTIPTHNMGTTTQAVRLAGTRSSTTRSRRAPSEYFYLAMAVLVAAAVMYGFSFTIGERLIHPTVPRPWVLYVHAVVFTGWLALFLMQSALVRSRKIAWHKTMGWVGVGWAVLIVVFGI